MEKERKDVTTAFSKYIDVIFILQNNLMGYAPKKFSATTGMCEYLLEDYDNELEFRQGMCLALANKIENVLSFSTAKERYKKEMHKLGSNWDIDATKAKEKENSLNSSLMAHAKMKYCFDNYLKEIAMSDNLTLLACLMAFYAKINKLQKEQKPDKIVRDIYKTNFYKYVKEVCLEEENLDIRKYAQLGLKDFVEMLFEIVSSYRYKSDNFVLETMLTADMQTDMLEVFVDDGNNDYQTFKKEFEQEIWDWIYQINENEFTTTS